MKLVHTGDWHLGQAFGGFSRDREHGLFLAWLLDHLEDERADALLVCGDVFDQGNPPAATQARYYDFLAEARRRLPRLDLVVIGGNHDAAPRLDAPGPILRSLGVHVAGALPRGDDGRADAARCLVPLHGPSGEVEAWCAAVPFLRMIDLPPQPERDAPDAVVSGVSEVYRRVVDAARERCRAGAALVALGHLHMQGGRLTDESERPVFGNAHALPDDVFPDDVAYAALGHLHLAQEVGGRPAVRYSGSPLPLSMTERGYRHQVLAVELDGGVLREVRPLFVPRAVDLVRVPEEAAPVDEVLDRLRALDVSALAAVEPPFVEVRVRLDAPCPDLRARVEQALEARQPSQGPVRLVRVHRELAGEAEALADAVTSSLADLEPVRVLEQLYARTYGGAPPADLRAAFGELLDDARGGAA